MLRPGAPPRFRRNRQSVRPMGRRPRRSACRRAESRGPGGCRRPLPACRRRRAAGCEALDPVERFAPTGARSGRKPGDQIDIDVVDAGRAQTSRFRQRRSRRYACGRCARSPARTNDCTPRLTRLIPARAPGARLLRVMVPGAASSGRFVPGPAWESAPACAVELRRIHGAGRAAAQVDRFGLPGPGARAISATQRVQIPASRSRGNTPEAKLQ